MWSNLEAEFGALKQRCFGSPNYQHIKRQFKDQNKTEELNQLRALENAYLYLISYVASNQDPDGWWGSARPFRPLITAHVVRLFSKMGVSLEDRWGTSAMAGTQGNLYRATKKLIGSYHPQAREKFAGWGDDFWDNCYILLALHSVRHELGRASEKAGDEGLAGKLDEQYEASISWAREQAQGGLAALPMTGWFGPGVYAAAFELFDRLYTEGHDQSAKALMKPLAKGLKPMLVASINGGAEPWHDRYAWHVGQVLAAWKELKERHEAINDLTPVMKKLYRELKNHQNVTSGAWDEGGSIDDPEHKVYYTVRALSACYRIERNPFREETVRRAHNFLLLSMEAETPLYDLKACVNALDALDKLFDLRLPNINLHLLADLTHRLDCLGMLRTLLNPNQEQVGILKTVREIAGQKLEDQDQSALHAVGANGTLFRELGFKKEFLNEFTVRKANSPEAEDVRIREELLRFLSSTMTEVRSNSARRLIHRLWDNEGYLNLLPLIERLSDLEYDRAFFRFYRDHLNHEVLLFMLGAYIYNNNARLRKLLNSEIVRTYEIPVKFTEKELAREFLFRWKMVATFHDIGYLFEVAPEDETGWGAGDGAGRARGSAHPAPDPEMVKDILLQRSFGLLETARRKFLVDYIKQYLKDGEGTAEQRRKRKEREAKRIARQIAGRLKEYQPEIARISKPEDLFRLETNEALSDAFGMIAWHTKDHGHIPAKLLRNYFDLCRSQDSKGDLLRSKFLDHGIMSALVLLKTADLQRFYLKQLTTLGFKRELKDVPELLVLLGDSRTKEHLREEQFYVRFSHVAGAIALHNVYPHLYTREQYRAFDGQNPGAGLEKAFYSEPLSQSGRYAIRAEDNPLAYLTALADVLQDWDRHSFNRPSFAEIFKEPISSSEVVLKANPEDGLIHVKPLTNAARKRYADMAGSKGFNQYLVDWDKFVLIEGI